MRPDHVRHAENFEELQNMLFCVEERFIDLSTGFDRKARRLLPGLGPEQKLARTETGGFPNTLIYKIEVDAPPRLCHEMFCKGVFAREDVNRPGFAVGQVRRLAGDTRTGDLAYHWVISADSLRASKEVNHSLDTVLRGQTTITKNWKESGRETIRFSAFSIDCPAVPARSEYNRVEFDIYGYEFKEVEGGKTIICHINHIQKGVQRTLGRKICDMWTRGKRNRRVYLREVNRLRSLKEVCERESGKMTAQSQNIHTRDERLPTE